MKEEEMKRRGFESFKKKLLRGAVAGMMTLTMTLGLVPGIGSPITAKADVDYAAAKTITGLCTGSIGNPTVHTEANSAWAGSIVYYGRHSFQGSHGTTSGSTPYRVLDKNTSVFGVEGNSVLLDCQYSLYLANYEGNSWNESGLRQKLNGSAFLNNTNYLTRQEKAVIAESTKTAKAQGDAGGSFDPINGDKVFILDVAEFCRASYGYSDGGQDSIHKKEGPRLDFNYGLGYTDAFLRSHNVVAEQTGSINGMSDDTYNGVSPAFNISRKSILFTSQIADTTNEYKFTVLDSNITVEQGGSHTTNGTVMSVPYKLSGSDKGNVNRLSVIVTRNPYALGTTITNTNNYSYIRLETSTIGTTGTGTFTIPSAYQNKTLGQDYHVYIVAEDVNEGKLTDYASTPVEILPTAQATSTYYNGVYDGNGHGITVTSSTSGATVKYGTSADNCTLTQSPTFTNVNDTPSTVYYEVSAPGYFPKKGWSTVTITPKTVGLNVENVKYTGQPMLPNVSATGLVGTDEVGVTVVADQEEHTNIGNYLGHATGLTGEVASNYKLPANPNFSYTIDRADAIQNAPSDSMSVSYTKKKVGDVGLPTGWTWSDSDAQIELSVGVPVEASAVYTATDKNNYTVAAQSKNVTLTRSTCKHPKTTIINKVAPKPDKEGYSGDTYCQDCKTVIKKGSVEAKTFKPVTVNYITHIQNKGWETVAKKNGESSGTTGSALRLEGIKIKVTGNENLGIQYTTHCQDYGWLAWSRDGEMNGTEGESKRLEAIMINLTGADKDKYDVYYRVHAQNVGWMNWAKNGEAAGTAGYAYRLEAIQIQVVKKGAKPTNVGNVKTDSTKAFDDKNKGAAPKVDNAGIPNLSYRTHVQNVGWQAWRTNGGFSGTSGRSLRLEGINIKLTNKDHTGGIRYKTHIQNIGWEKDWRVDGAMSGTSGRALRLEAIEIELYGEMANYYDVYYRVHAQNVGWMGWAKNGADAGTAGYGRRLEGIQIVLVKKGAAAPATNLGGINSVTPNPYLVTGSAAATPGRSQTVVPAQPGSTSTVYVTATGTKYHNDGCTSLRDSKIAISLEDAQKRGYEPCKLCH